MEHGWAARGSPAMIHERKPQPNIVNSALSAELAGGSSGEPLPKRRMSLRFIFVLKPRLSSFCYLKM